MKRKYVMAEHYNWTADRFLSTYNTLALANKLELNYEKLVELATNPQYRQFYIHKKSGGKREILAPDDDLIIVQRKLSYDLQVIYNKYRHPAAHGFVKKMFHSQRPRSIVSNAQIHAECNNLLNIDIKNFFPSISTQMVYEIFRLSPFRFSKNLSACLSLLCTYKGALPVGAPTSPVLANLYCLSMDEKLTRVAKKHKAVYTRYADDLTFSNGPLSTDKFQNSIFEILHTYGFEPNKKKLRTRSFNSRMEVTGLCVNKQPNVSRTYIRNIRAILHDWSTNGLENATQKHNQRHHVNYSPEKFLQSVKGKIAFIGMVKSKADPIYSKLCYNLKELLEKGDSQL